MKSRHSQAFQKLNQIVNLASANQPHLHLRTHSQEPDTEKKHLQQATLHTPTTNRKTETRSQKGLFNQLIKLHNNNNNNKEKNHQQGVPHGKLAQEDGPVDDGHDRTTPARRMTPPKPRVRGCEPNNVVVVPASAFFTSNLELGLSLASIVRWQLSSIAHSDSCNNSTHIHRHYESFQV